MSAEEPPDPVDDIVEDAEPADGLDVVLGDQVIKAPRNEGDPWTVVALPDHAQAAPPAGPPAIDEADSTEAPLGGLLTPPHTQRSTSKDRRRIAGWLLFILGVLVLTGCVGWLRVAFDGQADFQAFAIMFSPVVTLVGTVLAFYFGSPKD